MNTAQIIPFQFKTTEVRTLEINDLIWFVASDVAKALEYPQAKDLARMLDEDERGRQIVPTPSGEQEMVIINESGLYHAILKSRKPEAQPFRKWVTSEVLPAIRKTGRYEAPALPNHITEAQAGELSALVAERFPDGRKRPYAWGRFNNHFRLSGYKTLPASRFAEACEYIRNMPDKDADKALPPPALELDYSVERWMKDNPWFKPHMQYGPDGKPRMTVQAFMLYGMDTHSAINKLIRELAKAGHNMEACRIELFALRHFMEVYRGILDDVARVSSRSLDRTIVMGFEPKAA